MSEQLGWRGLVRRMKEEAPEWARVLPQLPRLTHAFLSRPAKDSELQAQIRDLEARQRRIERIALAAVVVVAAFALVGWIR